MSAVAAVDAAIARSIRPAADHERATVRTSHLQPPSVAIQRCQ
jgi:hypothetical protein